jgi:translation initiation factor eIF-2B subunit delta
LKILPDVRKRIDSVRLDREKGAQELAVDSLEILKSAVMTIEAQDAKEFIRTFKAMTDELLSARPSMSILMHCIGLCKTFCDEVCERTRDLTELKSRLLGKIEQITYNIVEANGKIGDVGQSVIRDRCHLMTHTFSSSVLAIFKAVDGRGKEVFVCESRPLCEGRKTAIRLAELGFSPVLITDAEAGHFMKETEVVLIGADSVLSDGSIVNKMGTYLIALAAKDRNVPLYCAASTYKFTSRHPELEEKAKEEVFPEWMDQGFQVRNVYFDVTPGRLIRGIITEHGIIRPEEVKGLL